jgi:hypothetical protein
MHSNNLTASDCICAHCCSTVTACHTVNRSASSELDYRILFLSCVCLFVCVFVKPSNVCVVVRIL